MLRKLVAGICLLHFLAIESPEEEAALLADKGAISQARYRVGAMPVVELFHRVCRPVATAETPGAFLFDLRLMAIDGTYEDVADTPENAHTFGRPGGGCGDGAFPQVMGVYLLEVGTHAIVDAGFWPCHDDERRGARRLLRSVEPGMLAMWDRGFHSFDMAARTRQQGADFLGRVPAHARFKPLELLPDGSYLAYMYSSEPTRRKVGEHMPVRIIDYTLDDPNLPGYGERHRLVVIMSIVELKKGTKQCLCPVETKRMPCCVNGSNRRTCAATCWRWRPACGPMPGTTARMRSCGASPACSTTWTTSAILT